MELIINIDKEAYDEIKKIVIDGNEMCFMQKLIANGTPLEDIKAEIEAEITCNLSDEQTQAFTYVLQIIDKHKAEGSDKE